MAADPHVFPGPCSALNGQYLDRAGSRVPASLYRHHDRHTPSQSPHKHPKLQSPRQENEELSELLSLNDNVIIRLD